MAVTISRNAAKDGCNLTLNAAWNSVNGLQKKLFDLIPANVQSIAACCNITIEDMSRLIKENGIGLGSSAVNCNEIIQWNSRSSISPEPAVEQEVTLNPYPSL